MLDTNSITNLQSASGIKFLSDSGSEADSKSTSDGFSSSGENEMASSSSVSETPFPLSSDDDNAPRIAAARKAARQVGVHKPGPQDAEKREGTTRARTRVFYQGLSGSVAVLGPKEGGRIVHALVSEQERSLMPACLIRDVGPEPTTFAGGLASQHSDV